MAQWGFGSTNNPTDEARKRGFICYNLAPEDKIYTCPYVDSHRILEHRLSRHLIKCRENYKKEMTRTGRKVEMGICKWNYMHHVPMMEMHSHEMMCVDAGKVVDHLMGMQNFKENPANESKKQEELPIPSRDEEDWESEIASNIRNGTGSYNPKIKLSLNKGLIIQHMPGITTKSERKMFRASQAAAFEARGGDFFDEAESVVLENGVHPEIPSTASVDTATASTSAHHSGFNVRLHRANDIAQAQRNAALSSDHHSFESKKRRSTHACDQISAILDLAHSETISAATSSGTLEPEQDNVSVTDQDAMNF